MVSCGDFVARIEQASTVSDRILARLFSIDGEPLRPAGHDHGAMTSLVRDTLVLRHNAVRCFGSGRSVSKFWRDHAAHCAFVQAVPIFVSVFCRK